MPHQKAITADGLPIPVRKGGSFFFLFSCALQPFLLLFEYLLGLFRVSLLCPAPLLSIRYSLLVSLSFLSFYICFYFVIIAPTLSKPSHQKLHVRDIQRCPIVMFSQFQFDPCFRLISDAGCVRILQTSFNHPLVVSVDFC